MKNNVGILHDFWKLIIHGKAHKEESQNFAASIPRFLTLLGSARVSKTYINKSTNEADKLRNDWITVK